MAPCEAPDKWINVCVCVFATEGDKQKLSLKHWATVGLTRPDSGQTDEEQSINAAPLPLLTSFCLWGENKVEKFTHQSYAASIYASWRSLNLNGDSKQKALGTEGVLALHTHMEKNIIS